MTFSLSVLVKVVLCHLSLSFTNNWTQGFPRRHATSDTQFDHFSLSQCIGQLNMKCYATLFYMIVYLTLYNVSVAHPF